MKIAMACALLSPPVFYILETMWTVAFRVLGLILAATMFSCIAKRLELLREVAPNIRHLAIVANTGNPAAVAETDEVQAAARILGLKVAMSAPSFIAQAGRRRPSELNP
jgi:hypothetical protein